MNTNQLPKTFKAAILKGFRQPFEIVELPIPELKENEVLIKVETTSINHLDQIIWLGHFLPQLIKFPLTIGTEGSGVIVSKHQSVTNVEIGTRVSFQAFSMTTLHGAYGEYSVVANDRLIPLSNQTSFEQGTVTINPLTAVSMLEQVRRDQGKAIISGAANSALGLMIVKYFQRNGIDVINIVRRDEAIQQLKNEGAKYVLNSTSPNFEEELKHLINQLQATIYFDPIGGKLSTQIFKLLPRRGILYIYGILDGQNVEISPLDVLINQKSVKYFAMEKEIEFNPFNNKEHQQKYQELAITDFITQFNKNYTLDQINEAFKEVKEKNIKILIKPGHK